MQAYTYAKPQEIKPRGWLLRQLKLQAEGLAGQLDRVWRDVRDSAWIGGDAEGWERVPYWLDGFVPLAYLLGDEEMQARAKRYIDGILAAQREDGWLCPCADEERPRYDTWAVQLLSKVLLGYYEASGDERVPTALYRMMKNYYTLLLDGTVQLFDWGYLRWFEAFPALLFLRERYGEPWITELGALLRRQGADFLSHTDLWRRPLAEHTMFTHVVNVAMLLKYEAMTSRFFGEPYRGDSDYLFSLLTAYHGTAVGAVTGDEHLSGKSPIAGTELCGVVELMYSFEQLFAASGDTQWLDRLEKLAFNALPATISADMWAHQYDQMSNQIACVPFPRRSLFGTNSGEAHLFGLEPNFGCCTANQSQGWPKLALSAVAETGDTLALTLPLPLSYHGALADVEIETDYPFRLTASYRVVARQACRLAVRLPASLSRPMLDGAPLDCREWLTLSLAAGEERAFTLSFSAEPRLVLRPHDLYTVERGPLVFSLPLGYEATPREYTRAGVERKHPYCDYEYRPLSPFGYGFFDTDFRVEERPVAEIPFSSAAPAVVIYARLAPISWGYAEGYTTVCRQVPASCEALAAPAWHTLAPYGTAKLRMTELPMVAADAALDEKARTLDSFL